MTTFFIWITPATLVSINVGDQQNKQIRRLTETQE
jgi:hypothetical protein